MDEQKKDYRVEQDSIGTKDVPKSVYMVFSHFVQLKIFILQD